MEKNKELKILIMCGAVLVAAPELVFAMPVIGGVTGSMQEGQMVTVAGSGFGTKQSAAPHYFDNFENDAIGQMPPRQLTNLSAGNQGMVQANVTYSGNKSLEFDYCADFGRVTWTASSTFVTGQVVFYANTEYSVLADVGPSAVTPNIDTEHFRIGREFVHCTNGKIKEDWKRNVVDLGSGGWKRYIPRPGYTSTKECLRRRSGNGRVR